MGWGGLGGVVTFTDPLGARVIKGRGCTRSAGRRRGRKSGECAGVNFIYNCVLRHASCTTRYRQWPMTPENASSSLACVYSGTQDYCLRFFRS